MRTLVIALVALGLAVVSAPAEAHISNDSTAGTCDDDGSVHYHSYSGCYAFPGSTIIEKLLDRPA